MTLLMVVEGVLQVAIVVLVATQIAWPAVTGGRYFPVFRRKDLHRRHIDAEEEVARLIEESAIAALRHRAQTLRAHPPEESK